MAVAEPSPSMEILVRDPDGFVIWHGPPFTNGQPRIKLDKIQCTSVKFSEDGSKLMVMKSDSLVSIYECKSLREIRSLQVPNVLAATISPRGSYLQSFQKPTSPQEKNVVLWKIDTGDSAYQLSQKNMTKATWYLLCFDELICDLTVDLLKFSLID